MEDTPNKNKEGPMESVILNRLNRLEEAIIDIQIDLKLLSKADIIYRLNNVEKSTDICFQTRGIIILFTACLLFVAGIINFEFVLKILSYLVGKFYRL